MNRTFKTIFNKTRGTYMVADENARAHGKTKSVKAIAAVALLGIGSLAMSSAFAGVLRNVDSDYSQTVNGDVTYSADVPGEGEEIKPDQNIGIANLATGDISKSASLDLTVNGKLTVKDLQSKNWIIGIENTAQKEGLSAVAEIKADSFLIAAESEEFSSYGVKSQTEHGDQSHQTSLTLTATKGDIDINVWSGKSSSAVGINSASGDITLNAAGKVTIKAESDYIDKNNNSYGSGILAAQHGSVLINAKEIVVNAKASGLKTYDLNNNSAEIVLKSDGANTVTATANKSVAVSMASGLIQMEGASNTLDSRGTGISLNTKTYLNANDMASPMLKMTAFTGDNTVTSVSHAVYTNAVGKTTGGSIELDAKEGSNKLEAGSLGLYIDGTEKTDVSLSAGTDNTIHAKNQGIYKKANGAIKMIAGNNNTVISDTNRALSISVGRVELTAQNNNTIHSDGTIGAVYLANGAELDMNSVSGKNILNGNASIGRGGAVYNAGNLNISGNSEFNNNISGVAGGAISNDGNVTIGGTAIFTDNTDSTGANDIHNNGELQFGGNTEVAERAVALLEDGAAASEKEILEHKYTYIGSGISGFGDMALNSGELEIAEGKHVEQGSATFKSGTTTTITLNDNHILKKDIVENASEVKDQIAGTVAQGGYTFHTTGSGLTVENGAVLQVAGAQANNTYLVAYNTGGNGEVKTGDNGWREDDNLKQTKIASTSTLLKLKRVDGDTKVEASLEEKEEIPPVELRSADDSVTTQDVKGTVMITAEAADISEVLPCVDAPKNLTGLVSTGINTNSGKAGVKFLSRATDIQYLSDTGQMTKTINSAVQIGSLGGVKDMTFSGSNMFQRSIENHLSLSRTLQLEKEDIKLHEKDHTDLWIDVIGQHTRRTGISGTCHGKECNDGNADSYGLRTDMGAIIVGLDRTNKEGDRHWGIAGMLGTGHAGSTGHLNHTKNDIDFWGLSLYGGIDRDNWNLMGNIAYSHFTSDIEQNLPSSLGMGNKLKADVSSHLWSVGGKAEYRYDLNESTAIKPHAGLRWDRMTTSGFSTKAQGESVFTTKRDTQDIYSLPVGLAFETGLKTDSGWVIRPQGDIAVVFAAGDLKDTNRFSATGVDAYDTIRTRIVDSTSITASVGVDMQKGNKSFGLHYDAVSSSNQLWQGFMAKFVYKFE